MKQHFVGIQQASLYPDSFPANTATKKHWLYILTIVLSLLSGTCCKAQVKNKYLKATVALSNGKSIEGYIKEEAFNKLNSSIQFKESESSADVQVLDTSTIKSFVLTEGVAFEKIYFKNAQLKDSIAVLARVLVRGAATLFEAFYLSEKYYLLRNNGTIYTLQQPKPELDNFLTDVEKNNFRLILFEALKNSSVSSYKIQEADFIERDIVKLVIAYNSEKGSVTDLSSLKRRLPHFVIVGAGAMVKNSSNYEYSVNGFYRTYFPKISRGTSLNVGISYFTYHHTTTNFYLPPEKLTSTLISLPLQLQQNLLNGAIRPYGFAGFNLSYLKVVNEKGVEQVEKGFQKNFGVGLLYGGGIEADIYKGLMINAEYRYEVFQHLIMAGIRFNFSKNNKTD